MPPVIQLVPEKEHVLRIYRLKLGEGLESRLVPELAIPKGPTATAETVFQKTPLPDVAQLSD